MNSSNTLAALVATALLATVGAASAQTVTGGGASLPADLKGSSDSILRRTSAAVTGSGTGKKAFLKTTRCCSRPPAPRTSPAAIRY